VAQFQEGVCVGVEYGFCSFLVDGFLVSKQKINVNGLREIFAVVRKLLSGGGGVCGELVV